MAWVRGADRLGNTIWFNPETGASTTVPPDGSGPAVVVPPPETGGGCWTLLGDVERWFIEYLGGPPHDDAEAIGYGRIGLPCDQVIAEISSSPEAVAFRATGHADPSRSGTAPPPGTVNGGCPVGQHKAFGVGPCVPDTIGPDLPAGLQAVLNEILTELDLLKTDALKDPHTIAADVLGSLIGKASPLLDAIKGIAASQASQLDKMLGGLPTQVAQLVGSALTDAESIAAAFLSNAATVEDVAGAFMKAIKGGNRGIFEFVLGLLMSGGSALAQQTLGAIARPPDNSPPKTQAVAEPGGGIAPELDISVNAAIPPYVPKDGPEAMIEQAIGLITGIMELTAPGRELAGQYAWALSPLRLLDAGTAASAEARGFIGHALSAELARRTGIDDGMHSIELELARARPDTGSLFTAWHRDEITTEDMLRGLARLGFDGQARDVLIAIARTLLGPDALARLSDRDLSRIGGSATFAGTQEITAEFVREGLDAGYSRDDIDRAWNLHYQPPDVGAAAELLHRGAIPIEAYRAALRANAVPPEWRAAYEVAAYVPFSRRDWLRLVEHKLIDHTGLVKAIMDNGYDAPRAELLAVLFEKLAAESKKAGKDPLVGPLTTQVLALREAGALPPDQTENALVSLGHTPDEIQAMLVETELRREVKRIADVVRLVRPLYVDEHWDWPRTALELGSWGIDVDHQAELKREWDLGRALTDQKPHQARAHELTVAEITAAFIDGEITEQAFRERLALLRFSPADVDLEVTLALTKRHKAEQADEIAQIEHAVLQGSITETQASDLLDRIGVTPGKRDRLLDGWLKTHANRREILTIAQLTSLLADEIINEEQLDEYMLRLPYGDDERMWLKTLIGSKAAAAQSRAAAAAAKAARAAAAAAIVGGA